MFVLGLTNISEGKFINFMPPKRTYERIDLYGDCTVDGIHVMSELLSEYNLINIYSEPTYGTNSILVGNFENSLEAGSILLYVDYPISAYRIRRKEVGDTLNPVLVDLLYAEDLKTYVDYTAGNRKNYTYTLSGIFSDGINTIEGVGLSGNSNLDFYSYILVDDSTTPPTQYIFDMEIELSDIEVVTDYKVYDNYTQFPVVHFGQSEYKTMKLKTMPYRFDTVNGLYIIDKNILEDVIDFLLNKNQKVLKLPSGEVMRVVTSNASYKYLEGIDSMPFHIDFQITEVGEV